MARIAKNPYAPQRPTDKVHLLKMENSLTSGDKRNLLIDSKACGGRCFVSPSTCALRPKNGVFHVKYRRAEIGGEVCERSVHPKQSGTNMALALDLRRENLGMGAGSKGGYLSRNDKLLKALKEWNNSQKGRGLSVKVKPKIKGIAEPLKRLGINWNRAPGRDSLNKTERYIIKSCLSNSTVKGGFGGNPEWKQGIKPVERNNLNFNHNLSDIPASHRDDSNVFQPHPTLSPLPASGKGVGGGVPPTAGQRRNRLLCLEKELDCFVRAVRDGRDGTP
jgi:hypothetical protein